MSTEKLLSYIGTIPNEIESKKRLRFHQGWWRAFVSNEPEGLNPAKSDANVCNTILDGGVSNKNFLSEAAVKSIEDTKLERKEYGAGLFNEDRLFNNLLSSQPLAFNFFGDLKQDLEFAKLAISAFIPEITSVTNVFFEFAPKEKYTGDNSAFDVAIEIMVGDKKGLLGLECKYTDTFSVKEYSREEYENIHKMSTNFTGSYTELKSSRFNQLFRNQLIAESLIQNEKYDFVYTGLFCFDGDAEAIETGKQFRHFIFNGEQKFKIITYSDFISAIQKQDITWKQRELTMLLWARYCGLSLSDNVYSTRI